MGKLSSLLLYLENCNLTTDQIFLKYNVFIFLFLYFLIRRPEKVFPNQRDLISCPEGLKVKALKFSAAQFSLASSSTVTNKLAKLEHFCIPTRTHSCLLTHHLHLQIPESHQKSPHQVSSLTRVTPEKSVGMATHSITHQTYIASRDDKMQKD